MLTTLQGQKANQWFLGEGGKIDHKGVRQHFRDNLIIILVVVMVPQIYTYVKFHQIVYFE